MKHIKHLFVVCLLLLVATTATAQSQSDTTQTRAVSATKADVNGDGIVNEADIEEILAIMQQENGTKYYWYVGWTKPTSLSHLQTLAVESESSHGGSTTSASGAKLLTNSTPITNPAGIRRDFYYVVIPTGYEIYDSTLPNDPITNNSFTPVTDVIIDNHKIYQSNGGTYKNSGLEIY